MREQGVRQQVVLVVEIVVQHAVGDLRLPGDVAHGQPGAAPLADQPRRGRDQVLAQVPGAAPVAVAEHGRFPR